MAFLTDARIHRQDTKSAQKRLVVAVRIRPLKANENGRVLHSVDENVVVLEDLEVDKNDVLRQNRGADRQFVFDRVFDELCSQKTVFEETTSKLVQDVVQGYNATVFAYGATGSGKTYTMLGTPQEPGIMVQALNQLFKHITLNKTQEAVNVSMSYLEIYNENIRDLLNPSSGHLELREDPKEGTVQVVKLSEVDASSTQEVMNLLQKGNMARTVESTRANRTSSRSHALLSVTVRQTKQLHSENRSSQRMRARVQQGRLFLIDLAGSERASQTKNSGKRLIEGGHINRSLLALGNCINALSGGARYVNYRDSKLTRLLKDALSGNSNTCMIAHISPAVAHREESKNTLLYADRAKNITNKVGKNILDISYHVSQYRTIISELRNEISRLRSKMTEERLERRKMESAKIKKGTPLKINELPKNIEGNKGLNKLLSTSDQMRILKSEILTTFKEQMRLRKKLLNTDSYLLSLEIDLARQHNIISQWEAKHNRLYRHKDMPYNDAGYDNSVDKAWETICFIGSEQEKYALLRTATQRELDDCKNRYAEIEKKLPENVSTEEEMELLKLLIKVHELEIEKVGLQSERLTKMHELRQRDLTILRYDRQRQICEEIITRQRQIMEDGRITLPADLQALYQLYQEELHANSYNDALNPFTPNTVEKGFLPNIREPLSTPARQRAISLDNGLAESDTSIRTPSSAGSDWISSPLPQIGRNQEVSPSSPGLPPAHVLFPPITSANTSHFDRYHQYFRNK